MNTVLCNIFARGKNRQGFIRYWCLAHHAPASKGSMRFERCVKANVPEPSELDILRLAPSDFSGGVAFWGAVPPVYDTTRYPVDFGIHVHMREEPCGKKVIDRTYKRVVFDDPHGHQHLINTEAAVYYMVSLVFEKPMRVVLCSHCGASHLDKDWFSVHPHKKHLCAACGRDFFDTSVGIGNPLIAVKEAYGDGEIFRRTVVSKRKIRISQADYPGGIRIWGSNRAIVWTAERSEEEGIHVHCYDRDGKVVIDDTFGHVTIDGISLDPNMVRLYMAQSAMPHLENRFVTITCPSCQHMHMDIGDEAFTPHVKHPCHNCNEVITAPTRMKLVIGNPLPYVLREIATYAPREPQVHTTDLRPEV